MYAKIINLLCADNTVFVKYQAKGGCFNPNPLAYTLVPKCMISWVAGFDS